MIIMTLVTHSTASSPKSWTDLEAKINKVLNSFVIPSKSHSEIKYFLHENKAMN